ncbi:MAG: hypothetical protein LBK71_07940 [Verrucomicrobiales bacterium]|jgi:hypothetical protein|nr:hypothetical protein [Verrucomicrobiales bacterium]
MKTSLFILAAVIATGLFTGRAALAADAKPQSTAVNGDGQTVTVKVTPIIDPVTFTVPAPVSLAKMKQAILFACPVHGWQAKVVDDHTVTATLNIRKHKIMVQIAYDTKGFAITYKNSFNLTVSDNSIHRNYRNWVENLRGDIAKNLISLD